MPASLKRVLRSAAPFAVFLACFFVYIVWANERHLSAEWTQAFSEGPLLLYLFALLRAPLRDRKWRSYVAALPIAWLYLLHDECFRRWGDVPSIGDAALVGDLMVVLGPALGVLVVIALLLPFVLWCAALDLSRLRSPSRRGLLLVVPTLIFVVALIVAPAPTYRLTSLLTPETEWADRTTAEEWGRIYAGLLRQARRASRSVQLQDFVPLSRSTLQPTAEQLARVDHRNVHLIIMESFVDLRLLTGVHFSKPPFDEELARWVDPFISGSVSPAFGGETARAEFEVLCGVPSLRVFGLEFLGFTGARTYCLPAILADAGYRSVLTFPHGPLFFNSRRAYPGLGFDQLIFADRFSPPGVEAIATNEVSYLEDGDLFPQNLRKVQALVKEGRPFLNYVLTMYGHWPFEIDTNRHPKEIVVSPAMPDLERIANQMLLRTRALRAHVQGLIAANPKSVIILIADHLPPLPGGADDYLRLGYGARAGDAALPRDLVVYENFLLVLVDGVPRKLPRMRHFDLSRWLMGELSHGATCTDDRCEFGAEPFDRERYLPEYKTILGLAAGFH